MQIVEFETNMKNDIELIFNSFLSEHDFKLPISAHARAGAEISDYLEDWFVGYMTEHPHDRIANKHMINNNNLFFILVFPYLCSQ